MAKEAKGITVHLSEAAARVAAAEAERTDQSTDSVVTSAAEEALKVRQLPGIAFRGTEGHRRAWILGTALDVWQVVDAYKAFGSDFDRTVAETDLSERHLHAALAYYEQYPEDVERFIDLNGRTVDALLEENPAARLTRVDTA